MVNEQRANVVLYGRVESGALVNDEKAFHAWVECDGWLIDFMAPIMGVAFREDGINWSIPRRMLQKNLIDGRISLGEIRHEGDLFASHDRALTVPLIDGQGVQFLDLMNTCMTWYRKAPKPIKAVSLADSHGPTKKLTLRAPSIDVGW